MEAQATPSMLEAALAYAARGWPVFPVGKNKKPLIPAEEGGKGFHDATTDAARIEKWWTRWPEAGIGNPPPPGELIIDIDPRAGGDRAFEALVERLGPLPPTVTTKTGGGGLHLRFKVPPGTRLPAQFAQGVELKGCGTGYAVLPPSLHPLGTRYIWPPFGDPEEQVVATLPTAWLKEIYLAHGNGNAKLAQSLAAGQKIGPSQRHAALVHYGAKLRRDGLPRAAAIAALRTLAETSFDTSDGREITDQEIEDIVSWTDRKEGDEPFMPVAGEIPVQRGKPELTEPESEADDFTVSLSDWDAKPAPPVRYLVDGLIAENTVNASIGKPYGGKSLSAVNRGLCMVSGKDWLDFKISKPVGAILYVDEEMGRPLMEARLNRMRGMVPRFDPDLFRIASRKGLRIDDEKWRGRIRRIIDKHKIKHAFFDTLRRLHSGNEDRSEEMAPLLAFFSLLRSEHECSSELLHHTKKNPDEGTSWMDAARGSGDIVAATDAMLGILKKNEGVFSFRADSKHAGPVEALDLLLDTDHLWLRLPGEGEIPDTKEEAADRRVTDRVSGIGSAIEKFLKHCPERVSSNAIVMAVTGDKKEILLALRGLEAQKAVDWISGPRGAQMWKWIR